MYLNKVLVLTKKDLSRENRASKVMAAYLIKENNEWKIIGVDESGDPDLVKRAYPNAEVPTPEINMYPELNKY